mmetsp:Transcript_160107/g.282330  ORF Transcript_160107/g.282330 Transcript_160107/m.282330 type:complete len:732 (+) Transcript_160107:103-2298(+)
MMVQDRLAARAYVEGREIVSDTLHDGEVVAAGRGFAWVKLLTAIETLDIPDDAKEKLQEMNTAVRKKAQRQHRRPLFGNIKDPVVYVGALDIADQARILRVGEKVKFKLYIDCKGVGGCEVVAEPPPTEPPASNLEGSSDTPPGDTIIPEVAADQEEEPVAAVSAAVSATVNENTDSSCPVSEEERRAVAQSLTGVTEEASVNAKDTEPLTGVAADTLPLTGVIGSEPQRQLRGKYRASFVAKITEEERVCLDEWYDGEVVQRSKTYAWVKPDNPEEIPADVQEKLQEMNDRFRKKAEESIRRAFCGGIEENVVYVANPDIAVEGAILCVGMKVRFKLYTDNKGVGGHEVIPSEEHINMMIEAIHSNFTTEEGLRKTVSLGSILTAGDGVFKDVLFIGECTHAFSLAAGRLLGMIPHKDETDHPHELGEAKWCSTELRWPQDLDRNLDLLLADNLQILRNHGIWCSDGIDAHRLQRTLDQAKSPCPKFDTVLWMMPFLSDRIRRPLDSIAPLMHQYIIAFVESAGYIINDTSRVDESHQGSIIVVVTSSQCLSWDLRQNVPTRNGQVLVPDVRWFDVSQVEPHGYQSRFGDGRDRYVDRPSFHRMCDMVAVRWRVQKVSPDEIAADGPEKNGEAEEAKVDDDVSDAEILERKRILETVGKPPAEVDTAPLQGCRESAPAGAEEEAAPASGPTDPEASSMPQAADASTGDNGAPVTQQEDVPAESIAESTAS